MNITSDRGLHREFWNSQTGKELQDQTHHFAAYFWVGARYGASLDLVGAALERTGDVRRQMTENALGQPEGRITEYINHGDATLGFLAAQWGDRMKTRPGYLGSDVERSLRLNCGWPGGGPRCAAPRSAR